MAEKFFTRKQAIELLNDRGYPVTLTFWEKSGPEPDQWFGNRSLYLETTLTTWAQSFLTTKPASRNLVPPKVKQFA